jgi:hypothetical protein
VNKYYSSGLPYSDSLCHYGIKGQKWGVRRFQNPDGTRTAAGKLRYRSGKFEGLRPETKEKLKETGDKLGQVMLDFARALAYPIRRNRPYMYTNEELDARIERLQKKKQYAALQNEIQKINPSKFSKGRKIVGETLLKIGTKALDKYIDNKFKDKDKDKKDTKKRDEPITLAQILENPDKYNAKEIQDAFNREHNLYGLKTGEYKNFNKKGKQNNRQRNDDDDDDDND